MVTQPQHRDRLAFGPFEVDRHTGELFKGSSLIRLPGQPFQILIALLESPGELISREQLRERIWRDGRNVDFEHSLNVAVNRLRRVLSDSADEPRYVETVAGKGYRFIAIVEGIPPKSQPPPVTVSFVIPEAGHRSDRKWLVAWSVLGVVSLAVILGAAFLRPDRKQSFGAKGTLVLAGFRNTTGDPVFDSTLQQGLMVQLQQSPFLSVVDEDRIRQTLQLMGRPAGDILTADLAREVCERTGSSAVLEGSIARLGSRYVLGLSARSCGGGSLYVEQVQAAQKEDVLDALSQIARKFRQGAGESLVLIRQHDTPLAEATTPSLEALKAYSTARKLSSASFSSAVPLLQRAIELDPRFATAHAFLGRTYADTGDSVLSAESTRRAYELRDRASEQERFFISFSFDRQVTGNLEGARRTLELWEQTYPREAAPHSLMSGITSQGMGRYETTIAEASKTIEVDPDSTPAYLNLAYGYTSSGRFEDAAATLERARKRNLEIPDSLILTFYLAFYRNDRKTMDQIAARLKGQPEEDWMQQSEALVAAHAGRLYLARLLSRQAVDLAQRSGHSERAAIYAAGSAAWEAFFGNVAESRKNAAAALKLSDARDVEYGSAFALSMTRDDSGAQALANDLARRFPQDTLVQFTYLPLLNALMSLHRHRPAESVSLLRTTLPFEFGTPGTNFFGFFGGLYPAYVRGQGYLSLGKSDEAAREFQKIINHSGVVFADPIGALVYLELGRARALSGNGAGAKSAYQEFFALWRDADPDIPVYRQAKIEFSRLR